mmetsp:Transcript_9285/g.14647  ORF Transcript_9285/g.14647 Transcript_9285/m.14647 type:complete len:240 (-) Transcript_9285:75-794(-)|eukprot:CAMPEP_0184291060 /NCGR_PEP_ID=MMETSP1049-20130417/3130_1 /TAXON_ID=77928 /ORGANISM="Proteomonas sulcata, Strain CCMP704" /LENGTH=239 /DNA_ID=CAMNT_0026598379 /DNA_START=84 /DNA_END=803 /DNA_ORIENTATION=-
MVNAQALSALVQHLKFPKLKRSKPSPSAPQPLSSSIHGSSAPQAPASNPAQRAQSMDEFVLKRPMALDKVHRFGKHKPSANSDNEHQAIIDASATADAYHYLLKEDEAAEKNRAQNHEAEQAESIRAQSRGNMSKLSNLWDQRHEGEGGSSRPRKLRVGGVSKSVSFSNEEEEEEQRTQSVELEMGFAGSAATKTLDLRTDEEAWAEAAQPLGSPVLQIAEPHISVGQAFSPKPLAVAC